MFPPGPFPPETGLIHHLWAWLEASLKMVRLRGQLALMEARQAGSHYGLIAGLFAGALLMALFGYVFLIITAVRMAMSGSERPSSRSRRICCRRTSASSS